MTRIVSAVIVLAALSPGATTAFGQTAGEPSVVLSEGQATLMRPADVAHVQVAVEARGNKPDDARRQAASVMEALLTALKGVVPADAIRTARFSVEPEMEYPSNRPQVRGYLARNQVDVRVDDLDKLAAVLDNSVASGATSISGLRFDVKQRDRLEREALGLAVRDAIARAEAIATGAGRTLGNIVRIVEQRGMSRNVTIDGVAMMARAGAATPVVSGDVEIRAVVSLTVALK